MKIKTTGSMLLLALITASCGGTKESTTAVSNENPLAEQLVLSTLWFQNSDEAEQLFEQNYELATMRLDQNLAKHETGRPTAVILDLDETVLDNSPYEARLIMNGQNYTSETWAKWVSEAKAEVLPGAKEFLHYAADKGVTIYYISNRSQELLEPTLENLQALELPNANPEHVLLKSETSDKTERRNLIKKKLQIVLLVGDQMTDFAEDYEEFNRAEDLKDSLNQHFVLLPNPMYGGFESKAYGGDSRKLSDQEKAAKRRSALEAKE